MTNIEKFVELYKAERNSTDFAAPEGIEYEIIEEGEWEQDHKYQNRSVIVKFNGDYFSVEESRSGSYHTDWFYSDSYVYPVERKEETKVVVSYPATGKPVTVDGRDW